MTQASNLAKAINKLMQSKLDSSLRERYFIVNYDYTPTSPTVVENNTTGLTSSYNYIDIGPDDIISINFPSDKEGHYDMSFTGKISEAIEKGYVDGNFIFIYYEPQEWI